MRGRLGTVTLARSSIGSGAVCGEPPVVGVGGTCRVCCEAAAEAAASDARRG